MNRHDGPRTDAFEGTPRMKYVVAVLAIAVGVAGVVAGGVDDSPGLQLLSVLLIIGAVAVCVRTALRSR
jgi:drug/metabolite transporter (DMT)-like permease